MSLINQDVGGEICTMRITGAPKSSEEPETRDTDCTIQGNGVHGGQKQVFILNDLSPSLPLT